MANLQDAARRMYAAKGSLSTSAGDEAKKITTENQLKEDPDKQKDPYDLVNLIDEMNRRNEQNQNNTSNNNTSDNTNTEQSDTETKAVEAVNTVLDNIDTKYSQKNMDEIQNRGVGVGLNKYNTGERELTYEEKNLRKYGL
jgi:phosphoserine aminotransferase